MRARFLGQKQAWSFNISSGLHASTTFPRRPPNEPPDSDTSSPLTAPAAAPSACSQPVACHTCIASSARATGGWRVKAHRAFNGARGASWDWCGSVSILGSHGCLESRSSTSRRLQCLRFLDTARDRPFCSRDSDGSLLPWRWRLCRMGRWGGGLVMFNLGCGSDSSPPRIRPSFQTQVVSISRVGKGTTAMCLLCAAARLVQPPACKASLGCGK